MKHLLLLILSVMTVLAAQAQGTETRPPYLQEPVIIPPFKLELIDGTEFSKENLPKNRPVVITYFDPECKHCQDAARELAENMSLFPKVVFVMAAYKEPAQLKEFAEAYSLNQFSNIKIGRDAQYFLPVFYQIKTTPFTAVYDKKGGLLKAFESGYTIPQLQELLK